VPGLGAAQPIEGFVDPIEAEGLDDRFDVVMSARFERFFFVPARGEGSHLAALRVEKLQRDVAETADPNHSDPIGGLDAELHERVESRDAAANIRMSRFSSTGPEGSPFPYNPAWTIASARSSEASPRFGQIRRNTGHRTRVTR
jgi:hypothetical protein